jgi:hypothetical protein
MEPETILLLSLVAFLFSLDVYLLKRYRASSAAKRSATGITSGHLDALKKGILEQQEPETSDAPSVVKPRDVVETAVQAPAESSKALRKGQSVVIVEAAGQAPALARHAPKRMKRRPAAR